MNTCAQFEDALIATASGDVAAEARAALDAHLNQCAACRTRFAGERRLFAKVDAGLMRMVAGEPSQAFAAHVMAQVTGEAERALQAQIDVGLAVTVAAEPSPQFAAAVRARIAAEPAPRRAWFAFPWWVPATGLAAAVILFVFAWPGTTPVQPPLTAMNNSVPAPTVTGGGVVKAAPDKRSGSTRPAIRKSHAAESTATNALEVLILPEERHVAGVYRFVQDGRLNAAQVLLANRIELAVLLGEMQTPSLAQRGPELKTLDLVDSARSTSDISDKQ